MYFYKLNLRLFDGEGGAEGASAAEGQDTAAAEPQAEPVIDRDAEFEALIKGEYKEQYDARMKKGLDRRFKAAQKTEQALSDANAIIDRMKINYGVYTNEELVAALEKDNAIVARRAAENGLTEEQQRRFDKFELDSRAFAEAKRRQEEELQQQQTLLKWRTEEQAMQEKFPGFALDDEAENEQFMQLLSAGVSMEQAYTLAHLDDIMSGTIQYAVQKTKQKVTNDIRARGLRPTENGAQGSVAAKVVKSDPSTWTDEQIEDFKRRTLAGERIVL